MTLSERRVRLTGGEPDGGDRVHPLAVAGVVLLALLVRLGLAWWVCRQNPLGVWAPDSFSYSTIAHNLLRHGVFSSSAYAPYGYDIFRTPGYPGLLMAVFALFDHPVPAVLVLQSLLGAATVGLAYLVGRRAFGALTALAAAILMCWDMPSIAMGQQLMSETAFTFCLVLGLWLVLVALREPDGWWRFLAAGAPFGFAVLFRAVAYYLTPALGAFVALALLRESGWRRALTRAALFLILPALLAGGWHAWNYRRTGSARFCHVEGRNLYFYRAAGAIGLKERRSLSDVDSAMGLDRHTGDFSLYRRLHPETKDWSDARIAERWAADGLRLIARNPTHALLSQLRGMFAMSFDPGSFQLAGLLVFTPDAEARELDHVLDVHPEEAARLLWVRHRLCLLLSVLGIVWLVFVYAGAVIWAARSRRPDWSAAVILLLLVYIYFLIVSAGPEAGMRFRVPVMPVLALFAAGGWCRLLARR